MPKEIEIKIKTSFDPSGFDQLKNSIANAESIVRTSSAGMQTSISGIGSMALSTSAQVQISATTMSTSIMGESPKVVGSIDDIAKAEKNLGDNIAWTTEKYNFKKDAIKVQIGEIGKLGNNLENVTSIQGDYAKEAQNVAERIAAGIEPVTDLADGHEKLAEAEIKSGIESNKVGRSFSETSGQARHLGLGIASLIANSVQLWDLWGRLGKKGEDQSKIMFLLGMNFIQAASSGLIFFDALGKIKIGTDAATISEILHGKAIALSNMYQELGFIGTIKAIGAKIAHTAVVWAHVVAKAAENMAMVIYNALIGPYGWAIMAGAGIAIAAGAMLIKSIPSKQAGGYINQTGPYLLHAGEYVNPKGTSPINITVYSPSPELAGKAIVRALKDEGVV
jgi:hypothetical protein